MDILAGTGHGTRMVLARAIRLDDAAESPSAGDLLVEAAARLRRREAPLDVVLVARDAAQALLYRLPGLTTIGVIAEQETPYPLPSNVSVVAGVVGALFAIPDGEWVIVDPARGRVVVQPGATEIARIQVSPDRPRVLLGAAHTPARTLSGATIDVWAAVDSDSAVDEAVASGADGLALTAGFFLRPAENREQEAAPLLRAAEAVGGGTLALHAAFDTVDPVVVTQVAAHSQAHWLLDPSDLPLPVRDLRAELADLVHDEQDAGRIAGLPRLLAVIAADTLNGDPDLSPDLVACEGIVYDWSAAGATSPERDLLAHFEMVAALAGNAGLPLRVWLPSSSIEAYLPPAVEQGAVGIIVAPRWVGEAKNQIRTQE